MVHTVRSTQWDFGQPKKRKFRHLLQRGVDPEGILESETQSQNDRHCTVSLTSDSWGQRGDGGAGAGAGAGAGF